MASFTMSTPATALRAPMRAARVANKAKMTTTMRAASKGAVRASAADVDADTGIKKMRDGIKEASSENLLTPRFYTTDFDEMERLFSNEINPNLD